MKLSKITKTAVVIIGNQLYMRKMYDNISAANKLYFPTNEDYLDYVAKAKEQGTYKGNLVVRQPYPVVYTLLKEDDNLFAFVASLYLSANEFAIQEMYHNGATCSAVSLISLPENEKELPSIVANDSYDIPPSDQTDAPDDHKHKLKSASNNAGLALARALHSSLVGDKVSRDSYSFGLPELTYKGGEDYA